MHSLSFKLTLAFLFVGVIGAILVGVVVNIQTRRQFDQFLADSYETALVEQLADFYAETGSWQDVNRALMQVYRAGNQQGERPLPWIVVDTNGAVIAGSSRMRPDTRLSQKEIEQALPIRVDGSVVGWLVRVPFEPYQSLNPSPEQLFLDRVTEGVLLSFTAAALVALLVGVFLARTITNPIKELTVATTAVAQGELGRQVNVKSRDEIGKLSHSFNQMSGDLARSSEQRRQMTADIAHELRTPLSIILGYTESLRDGILPPDAATFDILHDEAEHLSRLVQDLRTLSLADAGQLALNWQSVPPLELLQTVAAKYRHQAAQQAINLRVEADSNLPDIEVDPGRMEQVLGNLVSNALRFTPAQGEIRLTAVQPNPAHIQLSVQDSGKGIPPDILPKVFDRFYKADASRHSYDGESGLGLAIARSLVRMHGGGIQAASPPGQGATFTITLPSQRKEP